MLGFLNVFLLINISLVFVKCVIPTLSVKKLDRKLVARKRQDTYDMCRIFTEESDKIDNAEIDEVNSYDKTSGHLQRFKRNAENFEAESLPVNIESARRVESVVDKLYEDLDDRGTKVTYRKRSFSVKSTAPDTMTLRRFNFAPAILHGPLPSSITNMFNPDDSAPVVPWHKKWVHGIVPYYIDSKTYDSHLAEVIMKAFDYFEKATCIRLQKLRDRPTDKESLQNVEWLYITNPSGIRQCVHSNERKPNKGVQMVVIGYDCMSVGEIVHEVMHILGFSHEHTRPDRDQHITIMWNNIKPGYKKYFEIRTEDPLQNIPYDYASVLHYPPRAFSKNGQVTIMAQNGVKLGQREGLSETDIEKVSLIFGYHCVKRNKQYLLKTCPSVVKSKLQGSKSPNMSQLQYTEYFSSRLWTYGVVNYKFKDELQFTTEDKDNIKAVINHIEKETCIRFKDSTEYNEPKPRNSNEYENQGRNVHLKGKENKIQQNTKYTAVLRNLEENEIEKMDNALRSNKDTTDNSTLDLGLQDTSTTLSMQSNSTNTEKVETPTRRHADNILVLTRSSDPGCTCPSPGKPDGEKVIKINGDCFNSVNDLLHIFVHILGLDHQHNSHDRDAFLHILWDNLSPELLREMKPKLPPAASLGFAYDYQSVMHYPWMQIKNGVTNIMYPVWNDGWAMGHWQGLSSIDVQKLNLLYFEQCLNREKEGGM